jgi:hypothetical protein
MKWLFSGYELQDRMRTIVMRFHGKEETQEVFRTVERVLPERAFVDGNFSATVISSMSAAAVEELYGELAAKKCKSVRTMYRKANAAWNAVDSTPRHIDSYSLLVLEQTRALYKSVTAPDFPEDAWNTLIDVSTSLRAFASGVIDEQLFLKEQCGLL